MFYENVLIENLPKARIKFSSKRKTVVKKAVHG